MAFNAKVGSFAARTTAGSQSITGLGFTPKAVLFWAVKLTADGAGSGTAMPGTVLGMADGVTSCCNANVDDFTAGNPWIDPSNCISLIDHNGNGLLASLTTLDVDGFTLAWTAPGTGQAAWIVNYMALGGSDLNAKIISQVASATGNVFFTGAGFTPTGVLLIGGPLGGPSFYGNSGIGFGAGIGALSAVVGINQWGTAATFGGTTPGRVYSTSNCLRVLGSDGAAAAAQSGYSGSVTADGFTLNALVFDATKLPSGITTVTIFGLCLSGISCSAGGANAGFNQPTSPQVVATKSLGFSTFTAFPVPTAILFESYGKTAAAAIDTAAAYRMVSGCDGPNRGIIAMSRGTFGNAYLDRTNTVVQIADASPQTQPAIGACHPGFDNGFLAPNYTGGFTTEWPTADAVARGLNFFAMGLTPPTLGNYQLVQPIVHGRFP